MKVYISSTLEDLRSHRQVLAKELRKAGYSVAMMEEDPARDELVEASCKEDVSKSDAYVGIFGWRFGHVPEENNPTRQSITEMEYEAAGRADVPRLIFLSQEDAPLPPEADADRTRINALRGRLRKYRTGFFSNEHELSSGVLGALRICENTRKAKQLDVVGTIQTAAGFGASYMDNLKVKMASVRESALIEIQIGPTPWWNTRLYLIASLAGEFGYTRELVFVDANRFFLAMASPREIMSRLAARWPQLAAAYAAFRQKAPDLDTVEQHLDEYIVAVGKIYGRLEQQAVQILVANDLQRGLGITQDAEVVDVVDKGPEFIVREIIGRTTPFVALVRDKCLEGLVDRMQLAVEIATVALAHGI